MQKRLNAAIAALYEGAMSAPLETFQDFALEIARDVIAFDSALWITGVHLTSMMHSIWPYNRSLVDLAGYSASYADDDLVRQRASDEPGTTFRIEDTRDIDEYRTRPIYSELASKRGIEHAMGTTSYDERTRIYNYVILYRADRSRPFSDEDRAAKQIFMPHLIASWRNRHMLGLMTLAAGSNGSRLLGRGVIDPRGAIHASDADFGKAIAGYFPGWEGGFLPEPMLGQFLAGAAQGASGGLEFAFARGERFSVVTLSDLPDLGPLTDAESRVAKLFAEGLTRFQIAGQLGVSQHTVRNQLASVYAKLDVHSKLELVRKLAE